MPATTTPNSDLHENESEKTLELLHAVYANGERSQRSLASELGIALGLTNAYLKRCIRKGWIKARQAPRNRYAYYLTPKGFAEKSRLTTDYLRNSLQFYRRARGEIGDILDGASAQGWRRLALIGGGDLTEITMLCALQHEVEIVGIVDPASTERRFMDRPIVADLATLGNIDAAIITDLQAPQATYERYARQVPHGRLIAPPLLKITSNDLQGRQS